MLVVDQDEPMALSSMVAQGYSMMELAQKPWLKRYNVPQDSWKYDLESFVKGREYEQ